MGALETLRTEAAVIADAPWSFALCIAVVAVAIWGVMNWRYGSTIAKLKERLEAAPAGGGVPESLFQSGTAVASVFAPRISLSTNSVTFGQVFGGPHFDVRKEFEFRGHRLRMTSHAMATGTENAAGESDMTYVAMSCEIVA